jgi:hypothetical protein
MPQGHASPCQGLAGPCQMSARSRHGPATEQAWSRGPQPGRTPARLRPGGKDPMPLADLKLVEDALRGKGSQYIYRQMNGRMFFSRRSARGSRPRPRRRPGCGSAGPRPGRRPCWPIRSCGRPMRSGRRRNVGRCGSLSFRNACGRKRWSTLRPQEARRCPNPELPDSAIPAPSACQRIGTIAALLRRGYAGQAGSSQPYPGIRPIQAVTVSREQPSVPGVTSQLGRATTPG